MARKYFIDDLVAECNKALMNFDRESVGVSKRQVWEDIKFMKSREGWQIELEQYKEGKRMYYRYADPSFSIENLPFTEADLNQLRSAIQILNQFEGVPQLEWIEEMVTKIQYSLPEQGRDKSIISFDRNRYLRGISYLGQLFNAITYKKVLRVSYQDFKSADAYEVIIHPYFLKQYNNRWFLFGFNPAKTKVDWILALDRIKSIDELPSENYISGKIDWEEYFQNIIGVTKPAGVSESPIILHFYGGTCNYILTKPLHGSQKSRLLEPGKLEVLLELIPNYELEQLVLSFGDNVCVISPKSLVTKIKERILASIARYN